MGKTVQNNNREAYYDLLRIIACVMVLYMHSPLQGVDSNLVSAVVTYATGPCNALFFMVSGALLIKPHQLDFDKFISRRIKRILPPLLSWSVIYLLIKVSIGNLSPTEAFHELCLFPFQATGCGYFWFMYVLMGCYLLIPIVSSWISIASKRDILILLGLWFVCSFIPLITTITPVTEEFNSWPYYFSGFFGYMLMGYFLKQFPLNLCKLFITGLLGIVILVITLHIHPDFFFSGKLYFYTQPYIILLSIMIFGLLRKYCNKNADSRILAKVAEATFGIYLTHSIVMNYILKDNLFGAGMQSFVGMTLRVVITFVVCFIFIQLINLTPLKKILTV